MLQVFHPLISCGIEIYQSHELHRHSSGISELSLLAAQHIWRGGTAMLMHKRNHSWNFETDSLKTERSYLYVPDKFKRHPERSTLLATFNTLKHACIFTHTVSTHSNHERGAQHVV